MKALEFQARLNRNRTLTVPAEVARQIPQEHYVRVILLVSEPDTEDDKDWARMTAEQFLKGYAEGDAIYDQL